MDSLYASRRSQKSPQDLIKLENLSPEKYGKAAYVDLTYTPSKLADNYLYKEVTTLKKMEEGNNKLREYEASNSLFQDKLNQLREERDGIQQSLNSQIKMYKKLLAECEDKNEARIREIQNSFKEQMKILIQEKQEEAKFAQSEKQMLEERIEELQAQLADLKYKLSHHSNEFDNLKNEKEKLDIQYKNSLEKIEATQKKLKEDGQKAKKAYDKLNEQFKDAELEWKRNFDNEVNRKNKEIENLQRLQRNELEKIENKRAAEALMKNQEIKDLTNAFDTESKRLSEIINTKEKMIENLNNQLSKEKQVILELTRSYEKEINDLAHDKDRLLNEVDQLSHENTRLNNRLGDQRDYFAKEKADLQSYIISLKDELEANQVNYVREKDRSAFLAGDLQRQINSLRSQNCSLKSRASQNEILSREVRNLRELLLESSREMQRCKDEFIKMGKERDILLVRLKEAGCENEVLHKIKIDREEEARGWKQSYYMSKRY